MNNKLIGRTINIVGNTLIFLALLFGFLTFGPAIKEETRYQVKETLNLKPKDLTPPNKDFSIVIPKIEAVAPVFGNINPYDKGTYLPVLQKGVAHAAGTSLPGEDGNAYLFAHSTDAFYNVGQYNAVFYLLGKLEEGDEIEIYYEEEKISYIVREVKVVDAKDIKYLQSLGDTNTLTLQTCYPPGTTLKRLVVIADEV